METRRHLFKTSILSAFGLMSAQSVVQAAARGGGDSGVCTDENPVLVRPDAGDPVLLVPRADGKVEARSIKTASGEPFVTPLRIRDLLNGPQFQLSPVDGDITVHGHPIQIRHGFLVPSLDSVKNHNAFVEVQFGEILWIEGPQPPPPHEAPTPPRKK